MRASQDSNLKLTSTSLNQSNDGNYPYYVLGFLIPHEMLRREIDRGAHFLLQKNEITSSFIQYRWKAE